MSKECDGTVDLDIGWVARGSFLIHDGRGPRIDRAPDHEIAAFAFTGSSKMRVEIRLPRRAGAINPLSLAWGGFIVVGWACSCAGQTASPTAASTPNPNPTPTAAPAPTYNLFHVDSSTKLIIQYTIGPFTTNRFPIANGQAASDSQLVVGSSTLLAMPATATAFLTIAYGRAGVQPQQPIEIKGLGWDQSKGQYTAKAASLTSLATGLVDALNGSMNFDADHSIAPIVARVKISIDSTPDVKNAVDAEGYLTILFRPVATAADQQQVAIDQQQAAIVQEQDLTEELQRYMQAEQAEITTRQNACDDAQHRIDQEQDAAERARRADPADVRRWLGDAVNRIDAAQQQVDVTKHHVASTAVQVSVAQRQVHDAAQQFDYSNKLSALATSTQHAKALQQASKAQQLNQKAQEQDTKAKALNNGAKVLNVKAQGHNQKAQQQAARALRLAR